MLLEQPCSLRSKYLRTRDQLSSDVTSCSEMRGLGETWEAEKIHTQATLGRQRCCTGQGGWGRSRAPFAHWPLSPVRGAYSWDSGFVTKSKCPRRVFWKRGNSPRLVGKTLSWPVDCDEEKGVGFDCGSVPAGSCGERNNCFKRPQDCMLARCLTR